VLVIGDRVVGLPACVTFRRVHFYLGRCFTNGCASLPYCLYYTGVLDFAVRCNTFIRILLAGVTANIGSLKYVRLRRHGDAHLGSLPYVLFN